MANIPTLHFQLSFTESSLRAVRRLFAVAEDDELLLAVWTGMETKDLRHGFLFTRNGLAWNTPAMVETDLEQTPQPSGFLAKKDFVLHKTQARTTDEANRQDGKAEVALFFSDRQISFAFDPAFAKDNLEQLGKLISDYFLGTFNPDDYSEKDEGYTLAFTALAVKDFFTVTTGAIQNRLSRLRQNTQDSAEEQKQDATRRKTGRKQKATQEKASPGTQPSPEQPESVENSPKKRRVPFSTKLGHFFRHVIDFIADICLIAATIIFVKPELLDSDSLLFAHGAFDGFGQIGFFAHFRPTALPHDLLIRRNIFFLTTVIIYLVLKLFIALSCKKSRKSVSALLLVILAVDIFLVSDKFLVFSLLLLLALLSLQFSMGFSKNIIKAKCVLFVIACIIGYLLLHIALFPDFRELLSAVGDVLRFPAKWW